MLLGGKKTALPGASDAAACLVSSEESSAARGRRRMPPALATAPGRAACRGFGAARSCSCPALLAAGAAFVPAVEDSCEWGWRGPLIYLFVGANQPQAAAPWSHASQKTPALRTFATTGSAVPLGGSAA
jgi:hypothetical protein